MLLQRLVVLVRNLRGEKEQGGEMKGGEEKEGTGGTATLPSSRHPQ